MNDPIGGHRANPSKVEPEFGVSKQNYNGKVNLRRSVDVIDYTESIEVRKQNGINNKVGGGMGGRLANVSVTNKSVDFSNVRSFPPGKRHSELSDSIHKSGKLVSNYNQV